MSLCTLALQSFAPFGATSDTGSQDWWANDNTGLGISYLSTSLALLLDRPELLSLGSPRWGRGRAYLAPILVTDMKLLPVHLGNIVTEGSHPLRFDASDWMGPWPTPSFTSLCSRHKTDSADFLQSTGYRICANVFPFDQEGKSPHTLCKAPSFPCISPYFVFLS